MTAKEFVKQQLPKARAERHEVKNGGTYWLIRNGRNTMYFAKGKNQSEAWMNAKKKLLEKKED